jgi:hypothetical protein
MSNADASEVARLAARARWGSRVVSRAVSVVVERRDELDAEQLAQLAAIAGDPRDGDER